jgi:hypothetical protein
MKGLKYGTTGGRERQDRTAHLETRVQNTRVRLLILGLLALAGIVTLWLSGPLGHVAPAAATDFYLDEQVAGHRPSEIGVGFGTYTEPHSAALASKVYLPLVVSPLVPTTAYETEFEGSIDPWKAVRWQKSATYALGHNSGCDSGECNFLDLVVDKSDTYAITSPLILGPNPPYVIEFRARLRDRQDKHQYGVVFGGDWHSGACPGDNTNTCFNHYYEFRVRYRDVGGDTYLEYQLRRIDGHDGNNVEQGAVLVEWTRAEGLNGGDWVKWSVRYNARGRFTFKANNKELAGSADDSKYDDPLHFGLFARAGDNGDARARFDSFSIKAE